MSRKIGSNPKAVEAREREKEQKKNLREEEDRKKEDAKWVDDDKKALKKMDK